MNENGNGREDSEDGHLHGLCTTAFICRLFHASGVVDVTSMLSVTS